MLVEGVVVALAGGMAGLCLSFWITKLILGSMQPLLPLAMVFDPSPDFRVLAATLGFCMVSTLFFAAGPAWKLSRPDVVPDLKQQKEGTAGLGRLLTARNLLVIGQISLSLTLLAAARLFVRGAWKAAEFNPGFRVQDGVLLEFDSRMAGYDEAQGRQTAAALVGRVGAMPGVESVSIGATVPFGMLQLFRNVQRAGIPPLPPETRAETPAQGKTFITVYNAVGPDYFKTLLIIWTVSAPILFILE